MISKTSHDRFFDFHDKARCIAASIGKLPDLLRNPERPLTQPLELSTGRVRAAHKNGAY
jgi:hypothetical protein